MHKETISKLLEAYKHLKLTNKQLISSYNNGYLGKNVYQISYSDKTTSICEQLTKNNQPGHAVVILPLTSNNEIIMVLESRPNTKENVSLSFPAGMVDGNENTTQTALRELLEETGFKVSELKELEWHYQDQGCSSAIITTYLALNCIKVASPKLDGSEKLEHILITQKELSELYETHKITDANSKIAYLEYTRQRIKIKGENKK